MANKYNLIALANMAHYWIGKGKIANTYECLNQIIEELNKPDKKELTTNTTNSNNNTTFTWR